MAPGIHPNKAVDREAYYARLWTEGYSSTSGPSVDEQTRAKAIFELIEKYVVPTGTSGGTRKILDLGCGRGWLTHLLAAYGVTLGVDPVQAAVTRARELFPTLRFEAGDGQTVLAAGGAGQYDLIVSSEVIEHVPDADKAAFLQSIHSLLKAGGMVILTTPRGELWNLWKQLNLEEQPVEQWISERDLDRACQAVPLTVVARDRVYPIRFRRHWKSRLLTSSPITRLRKCYPNSKWLHRLCYPAAFYQVVLLRRN